MNTNERVVVAREESLCIVITKTFGAYDPGINTNPLITAERTDKPCEEAWDSPSTLMKHHYHH